MHTTSMNLMKEFIKKYDFINKKILDVGGMNINGSYKELMPKICEYECMDVSIGNDVNIVCPLPYDWKEIPSEKYDVVISGQCLEHVPMPWLWIKEITRVAKTGGLIIIIAPWQWRPHYHPFDCWRILPDGMKGLFEYSGIKMLKTAMSNNDTYGIGVKL